VTTPALLTALPSVNLVFLAISPKRDILMPILPRLRRAAVVKATGEYRPREFNPEPMLMPSVRGTPGDEVEDLRPNMAYARRRSNSSTQNMKDFKTKFETIETEPVFEEELHGPMGEELEKQSTTSTDKSVDDEEEHHKKF
jgi:hypothetical protein